jgi:hypothetical protein
MESDSIEVFEIFSRWKRRLGFFQRVKERDEHEIAFMHRVETLPIMIFVTVLFQKRVPSFATTLYR